jgi:hypothetical protein
MGAICVAGDASTAAAASGGAAVAVVAKMGKTKIATVNSMYL